MIRVAVVDDQALVRMGLRVLLESEPDTELIGEAADGAAGLGLVREAADEQGFLTPLTDAAHRLYERGSSLGLGGEDDSGVVRVFERTNGAGRTGDSSQI